MEIFRAAPIESSFVPITEHQSQTPASFYSGPPVLYYHHSSGQLLCHKDEASRHPAIEGLTKDSKSHEDSWLVDNLDIWVTSETLKFWSPQQSTGISIPYRSISLHALGSTPSPANTSTKVQALYLELAVGSGFDDHDEESSLALNYLPSSVSAVTTANGTETPAKSICQQIYDAVTDCANLHPDPASPSSSQDGEEDEEDEDAPAFDYEVLDGEGGLPAPFPGSGGWITAENMDRFFDEEGNWRAGGLGPGAGMVRERNGDGEGEQVNGDGKDVESSEETKWRRTE